MAMRFEPDRTPPRMSTRERCFLLAFLAFAFSVGCVMLNGARVSRIGEIEGKLLGIPAEDPRFKASVIGAVDYDGKSYPILAVEYRPPGGASYSVLNTGGVHGDEAGGVETIYQMIRECALEKSGALERDFILCMNPWGYGYDKRDNRDGIDLNRDFKDFRSQEARIVAAFLKGRKYDLVVDHHENSHSNGFSIICHEEGDRSLASAIIRESSQYGVATKTQRIDNYEQGITILGLGNGKAFSQYAGLHLCEANRSFIIETPTAWDIEKRIRCQLDVERKLEKTFFL
jgi:hypothetical protein